MVLYPVGTSTAMRIGKSDPGSLCRVNSPAIAFTPAAIAAPASSSAALFRSKRIFFIASPQFLHVVGRQDVGVAIAEIRPHVVHHGGDLCVVEIAPERRHAALSVEDNAARRGRRSEARILLHPGLPSRTLTTLRRPRLRAL